ncbi:spore coat U domain-containing protein [Burkholderia sp. FERM BP-3421]|uniref:Csu type fimbrial protein n=1 Tax=Burkholderia sp. FERM BP-3421 TaxID=1494466 RepID=UPI002361B6FC|nr:spore coat U domain-containing protein [Burkholderia sp. FERM BP-3421]WDD91518.1 spore coat U domain-containing protein [Burkholderia sp. FERM BP-3421]
MAGDGIARGLRAALWFGALAWPGAPRADTPLPRTQAFGVSAQIVAGCGLRGAGAGALDLGPLDFGVHPAVAAGTVTVATAGHALQLECSPGTTLALTIDGGRQPGAGHGARQLTAGGGVRIPYRLYADAARTRPIGIGQAVSMPVSGIVALPIYGELSLPGGGVPAGVYTDTAQVTFGY